jgi:hypothetical protein
MAFAGRLSRRVLDDRRWSREEADTLGASTIARRAVRRGARRGDPGARGPLARSPSVLRAAGSGPTRFDRRAQRPDETLAHPQRRAVLDELASTALQAWSETSYPHAGAARRPRLRARGVRRAARCHRPRPRRALLRPVRGRRRAVHRQRRAPRVAVLREQGVNGQFEMAAAFERAGFDPGRRAHDRPAGRSHRPRRLQRPGRLRRLLLRRRARRGAGLGQVHPVQRARRAREFEAFFGAATPSRSACATAAR